MTTMDERRQASLAFDAFLLAVAVIAAVVFWALGDAIDVEATHEVGDDSSIFQAFRAISGVVFVASLLVLVLRRPVRRALADVAREREMERRYEELDGDT